MTAEEIFTSAPKDERLKSIVQRARAANAQGIGMMLNLFPVDYISIMGSVGINQFSLVIPTPEEIAPYTHREVPPIHATALWDLIGIWGAYEKGLSLLEKK